MTGWAQCRAQSSVCHVGLELISEQENDHSHHFQVLNLITAKFGPDGQDLHIGCKKTAQSLRMTALITLDIRVLSDGAIIAFKGLGVC
jgi:hypothetical protein